MLKKLLMILAIAAMCLPLAACGGCHHEPDVQVHQERHLEVHELPVSTQTVVE